MKNFFKLSLATLFTLSLITSCEKDDKAEIAQPNDQNVTIITEAEMQNKDNPNDEQGVLYIATLNAISSEQGINGWDVGQTMAFRKDIGGWDVGQIVAFNGDIGGWDVGQLGISSGSGDDIGGWDVGQIVSFAMAINGGNGKDTSARAKDIFLAQLKALSALGVLNPHNDCWVHPDWCKDFINPIKVLDDSKGGDAHDRTIAYIKAVRSQEAIIMVDDSMNKAEKEAFLISYSIARHAAGYWYNAIAQRGGGSGKVQMGDLMITMSIMNNISTLGATTAYMGVDSREVGISTAILNIYTATGRAKIKKTPAN